MASRGKRQAETEHILAAILFSDIAGFSTLTDDQIDIFARAVLPQISAILEKRLPRCQNTWGDAVYAIFAEPSAAAMAAIELRDLFRKTDWRQMGLPDGFGIRIALHAATVALVSNPVRHRAPDAFGKQINFTARIEPIVGRNEVWATQLFVDQLDLSTTQIRHDPIGSWELVKGWGECELQRLRMDYEPSAPLQRPVPLSRAIGSRGESGNLRVLKRIIQRASAAPDGFLCVAGIANKELFQPRDSLSALWPPLQELLSLQRHPVRVLFLDPQSAAARAREVYESKADRRVPVYTCSTIETSLKQSHMLMGQYSQLRVRTTSEVPVYLFFNQEEMLFHPYFSSAVGQDTDAMLCARGTAMYETGRKHFENHWGERWVLLDLGNVLVTFDHTLVSAKLWEFLGKSVDPLESMPTVDEIHAFFFARENGKRSRNDELDLGHRDLEWLREAFCEQFACSVDSDTFSNAWNAIFGREHSDALSTIKHLQRIGTRVAICSNTNSAHWSWLMANHGALIGAADEIFRSYELGSRKPDREFFEKICKRTASPPYNHFLIDDIPENIAGAQASGLHAELFTDFHRISEWMQSRLWV